MKKRYYKIGDTATYINFSVNTIRKWVRTGQIPYCRMNGGIRFDIQKIDKWIRCN